MMMDTFYVQLTTLLVLLLGNFLAGLVPLCTIGAVGLLSECEHIFHRKNRVIAFFLHLGGGAFMSICLLILLPESQGHFKQHEADHHTTEIITTENGGSKISPEEHQDTFPIPEFIVLCGFFATFAIEEFLHYILFHFRRRNVSSDVRVRFCSCAKRHTECSRTFKIDVPDQTIFGLEKKELYNAAVEEEYSEINRPTEQVTNMSTNLLQSSIIAQSVPNYGSLSKMTDTRTNQPILTPPAVITNDANEAIARQQQDLSSKRHFTSNILLLVALSCHAILMGITIGLTSSSSATWALLLVLCLQQTIIAFIVGNVGLSNSGSVLVTMSFITTISIMSPFGIGLAMFFANELLNQLVFATVKGILCGSLMYFTFYDLLRRSRLKDSPHADRFAGFTLGASVVAILLYVSVII